MEQPPRHNIDANSRPTLSMSCRAMFIWLRASLKWSRSYNTWVASRIRLRPCRAAGHATPQREGGRVGGRAAAGRPGGLTGGSGKSISDGDAH